MMDCPLTNQGPYTFTNRIGANEQENPANQISVDLSLETNTSTEYTHFGKVFRLIDRRFADIDPLRNAWSGQTITCCAHALATGQENGPRREHDGGMEERRGGDGETSSVPGA